MKNQVDQKQVYYQRKLQNYSDLEKRKVTQVSVEKLEKVKKIYIVAICGKAMASLAELLHHSGYQLSGSDQSFDPPMSEVLQKLKIPVCVGYNKQNIIHFSPDIVVVGNTIKPDNVETAFARQCKIPQMSVVDALRCFIFKNKKVIVIAGTHGKTTTTGMLVHVLKGCKMNPGYLIGGVDCVSGRCAELGEGQYFVIEGDQYGTSYFDVSPKFLGYNAHSAIITSVQLDHVNFFTDFQDYKQAFKYFTQNLPKDGILMSCKAYKSLREIETNAKANKYLYSVDEEKQNSIRQIQFLAKNVTVQDNRQSADLYFGEQKIGKLKTQLFGKYNLQNCVGVFGLSYLLGCKAEQILKFMESYKGMKRRQQIIFDGLYKNLHVTVVDDYAHHPTAVQVTISGLKQRFNGRKLTVVYEFSSTSSTRKQFQEQYRKSFEQADCVLLKKFQNSTNNLTYLSPDNIVSQLNINNHFCKALAFQTISKIKEYLLKQVQNDQVVVFMSAKMFQYLPQELVKALQESS